MAGSLSNISFRINMASLDIIQGYIPPPSFAFSTMSEALAHYISALCSSECARFVMYIETHPSRKNAHLTQFLSPYALADWATGTVDEIVWRGRGRLAKESLQMWAMSMIEFNTLFREQGIVDPIKFVEDRGLVQRFEGRFGWEPNIGQIDKLLKLDIASIDISKYILSTE